MFESLMPDLLVPETEWGPRSWALNHPITVAVQKRHGLDEAGYGYWGFSPASNPFGGYSEYGVDIAGIRSDGYTSDAEKTDVDIDRPGCTTGTNPDPTFGDGVVTPHAAFLALPYDRPGVLKNLRGIEKKLGAYGPGGFYDAVAVKSDTIAKRYLSLDQSMILAAIGNALTGDTLKDYFVDDELEQRLRPAMEQQVFDSSWGTRRD
ncbi:glucoamylase family protein [Rhodococcus sp. IEGM 1404]|nr:glucoamylase family protein [Microbacterium sp. IEGM 1404]